MLWKNYKKQVEDGYDGYQTKQAYREKAYKENKAAVVKSQKHTQETVKLMSKGAAPALSGGALFARMKRRSP